MRLSQRDIEGIAVREELNAVIRRIRKAKTDPLVSTEQLQTLYRERRLLKRKLKTLGFNP